MQRWFFADDIQKCDGPAASASSTSSSEASTDKTIPQTDWNFCIQLQDVDLYPNEKLAITGNIEELGNWQLSKCIHMTRDEDKNTNLWRKMVRIPRNVDVEYRYLVIAVDPASETTIVRRWETHLEARKIEQDAVQTEDNCTDEFGEYEGKIKIDRGWLTSETIVQFNFFNAPFKFKERLKRRLLYVKVTPMNLKIPANGCENSVGVSTTHMSTGTATITALCNFDDSLSSDLHDTHDNGPDLSTTFAFNEVASLKPDDSEIHAQPQFGTACGPDDMLVFHLTIGDLESTAYLIDLYSYSSKAGIDEPPYHIGYQYVLPNLLKRSEGYLDVPITCASRHRPMGMMQLGYLLVRPLAGIEQTMQFSYARYWNPKFTGLDVGHRGLGTSFKANESLIRENTITSLKNAAEHGADMVEFDVQLSKDLVPVVYHDFMVYVLLKAKGKGQDDDYLSLPLRELTLEQLRSLKVSSQ